MNQVLRITAPGRLEVQERPPQGLDPDDARVRVIATGICGSDVHGLDGHTGRRSVDQVMGHETVGQVIELGADADPALVGAIVAIDPVVSCGQCSRCRVGEQQHCLTGWVLGVRTDVDGAYATEVVVPSRNLVPLRADMTPWHGALVEPLAVGFHAARRGHAGDNDRVLILGGGPIGQAVLLGCLREGVRTVLVSEPDDRRGALIERLGGLRTTPQDLADDLPLALGEGATLAFDVVGTNATLATAIGSTVPGGRVVLVGMDSPKVDLNAYEITARERMLVGTICSTRDHFVETAEWLADHPEIAPAMVDHRVPLAHGPDVFDDLLASRLQANKILLLPETAST